MQEIKVCSLTLSPARILKEAITWSAVSVSAVSRDMKSMKAWNVTTPKRLGSTMLIMRANSASPCRMKESRKPGHLGSSATKVGRNCSAAHLTARKAKPNRKHFCVGFFFFLKLGYSFLACCYVQMLPTRLSFGIQYSQLCPRTTSSSRTMLLSANNITQTSGEDTNFSVIHVVPDVCSNI